MSGLVVEAVLIRHFLLMPSPWPILLPNGAGITGKRRYVVEGAASAQGSEGVSKVTQIDREINIRVEVPEGTNTNEANEKAQAIADWFPKDTILEEFVEINEMPSIRPGYFANGLWVVPVLVRGRAYFN